MIDTSNLKDGDKCLIWISKTYPCGCETEGEIIRRVAIYKNGVFQSPRTYEVFGSSVLKYKMISQTKRLTTERPGMFGNRG
jgi:hypothetical protein